MQGRVSPQELLQIRNALMQPDAVKRFTRAQIADFKEVLDFHKIEFLEIPSDRPGDLRGNPIPGNPGASPKQLDLQRRFLSSKYRVMAASGANRSGKTISMCNLCFCKHLRDRANDGDRYWVMATDFQRMVDGPMRWLWETLPQSMFGKKVYTDNNGFGVQKSMSLYLTGQRGKCSLVFKTEEQPVSSFESVPIHGAYWTEAQREALFDAVLARTIDYGGFFLLDYVPTEFWHRARLKKSLNPRFYHTSFATADNAHNLPAGEMEMMKESMTDQEYQVRVLGKERAGFGVVYTEYQEDIHRIPCFKIPKEWPKWRALDYGGTAPTACIWGTIAPMGYEIPGTAKMSERLIVYREYYRPGGNISIHADSINALSLGEDYTGRMLIDPHAYDNAPGLPKPIARQYQDHGLRCKKWPLTTKFSEEAMVALVKIKLEHRTLLVTDNCVWVDKEMGTWHRRTDREGMPDQKDVFSRNDNHTLDAIRGWVATGPIFTRGGMSVSYVGE